MAQSFVIECKEKVQIPGHGWLIEGFVREGVAFPDTDIKLVDVVGRRILIGTILGFIQGDDVADYVMEGQTCGVLMRYVDLTDVELDGCILTDLQEA